MEYVVLFIFCVVLALMLLFNANRCFVRHVRFDSSSRRGLSFKLFFGGMAFLIAAAFISREGTLACSALLLIFFNFYTLMKIQKHKRDLRNRHEFEVHRGAILGYVSWYRLLSCSLIVLFVSIFTSL